MKQFMVVVAADASGGIGKNGTLPWHLPADLKRFKDITVSTPDPLKKNAVIMGRKTWESLPPKFRPLPGRVNCVLTRQFGFHVPEGVVMAADFSSALDLLSQRADISHIYVIGGGQLFKEVFAHPLCRGVYLTSIQGDFHCDTFLPEIPVRLKVVESGPWCTENSITYRFMDYAL